MFKDSLFLLYLFVAAISVIVVLGAAAILFFWMRRRAEIKRSLNLKLLMVRLPMATPSEESAKIERVKEKIAVMEQLYASLAGLKSKSLFSPKPWMAFEMTVPAKDTELSFYAAVPRKFADSVEKLIYAYYPDASVANVPDYNIFTDDGKVAASAASLTSGQVLPIRTYKALEADPMKGISSLFSKLDEMSEGAAVQIIFRPAKHHWRKELLSKAKSAYEGKSKSTSHAKILEGVVTGPTSRQPGDSEKHKTLIDENRGKVLEAKASEPLFEVNLRLMASAPTDERASVILHGLEQAFLPLNDPNFNSIKFSRVPSRKIKREVMKYAFRLFDARELMALSASELTSLYHFPNTPLEVPGLAEVKSKELAPPADLAKSGMLLGHNLFRGVETRVYMTKEDRRRHFYVIGQTGTGKSVFLKNQIVQDIQNGEGVCVIDPHGDLTEYALGFVPDERLNDVIYFDPADTARPLGLNMLEYDERFPEQKTLLINELLAIFEKLFNMSIAGGPLFEQYFRNAALLVMEDPASGNTLLEITRVLADKEFRAAKLVKSHNILVNAFWTQVAEKAGGDAALANMVPYITSKFDVFLSNDIMRPIIAQPTSSFNFRDAMDQKKILLINLSKGRLGEINSSLLGLILVGKLLLSALSRANIADENARTDFYLYIDEFHNVTTKSIATILSEARKYRLSMTMTHQFIGQLEEEIKKAVFGNVGSLATFRIGSDDGEFMEKQFTPDLTAKDLLSLDNFRCYVKLLVGGKTSKPFSMRTYEPAGVDKNKAERVKELSRTKYGRPREEVEADITRRHTKI
ncbi:MAG: type IV secretion system DNA-binding domain-containing protein [Candidatus Sungbacteria bacterium]|nr:type IV secretion system DNA-binding domain-containing protein [Candidatus Sungbacteria bacterium]